MSNNPIKNKSFDFAVRIVNLYKTLTNERKEFVMSKQLLRSGTSIGANIEEATASISKKEFISKNQISYKEAFETSYWLKLLHKTEFINDKEFQPMINDNEEIIKILTAILKTSKNNL
ncbi:MAG: four helix bundle protein [Cruoricaptor ignavus]|nr:four helix bundle protein [Cruoricaptor ignavus]